MAQPLAFDIIARDKASQVFDKVGRKSEELHGRLNKLTATAARLGGGLVFASGVGTAVAEIAKIGMSYENNLNIFQSVSKATGAQMDQVSAKARQLGADTKLPGVSAAGAAEAMTELAKAGLNVRQSMEAARATLLLARVANLSEAEAAEIAGNAVNAFGLKAKDVSLVVDELANAANSSSLEVKDASDSFKMAAAVFAGFQGNVVGPKEAITELTTSIALLGNAGIKGSDAGTSLKQMLLQLTGPSTIAKDAMKALYDSAQGATISEMELTTALTGSKKKREAALQSIKDHNKGLKLEGDIAYDASGKMRPLREIIDLVAKGTKGMSDETRNSALTTIFGADATRAVIALMKGGLPTYDKMHAAILKQGGAADFAAAKNKGLSGAIDNVRSQFENAAISIYTQVKGPLTSGLNTLADKLPAAFAKAGDVIGLIMPNVKQVAGFIAEFAKASAPAALGALAAGFGALGVTLKVVGPGLEAVGHFISDHEVLFQRLAFAVGVAYVTFKTYQGVLIATAAITKGYAVAQGLLVGVLKGTEVATKGNTAAVAVNTIVTRASNSTAGTWLGLKALEMRAWLTSTGAVGAHTAALRADTAATGAAAAAQGGLAAKLGLLGKIGGVTALLTGIYFATKAVGGLFNKIGEGAPKVAALAESLRYLGQTGVSSGALLTTFGGNLGNLDVMLRRITDPSIGERFGDFATTSASLGSVKMTGDLKKAHDSFKALDTALQGLVKSGGPQAANQAFEQLVATSRLSGDEVDKLKSLLPKYSAATAGATAHTKLYEQSLGGLLDKLDRMNGGVLTAAQAEIDFRNQTDLLTKTLVTNGRTLSLTTQAGRDNRSALIAATQAALASATAAGQNTAAHRGQAQAVLVVSARLTESRTRLINAAVAAGISRSEARKLVDQYLKIPTARSTKINQPGMPTAHTKTDSLTTKLTDLTKDTWSVGVRVNISGQVFAAFDKAATGGSRGAGLGVLRRAVGGSIPGWGGGDRVPLLAEPGEEVIRKESASPNRNLLKWINAQGRKVDLGGDPSGMFIRRAAGGSIPGIQSWLRGLDGGRYVWGATGPRTFDCSGLVGSVWAQMTGRSPFRRYFTTANESSYFAPGPGTFTVGIQPGVHTAGNLAGLPFEAASTRSGIHVGHGAKSVMSFPKVMHLASLGGRYMGETPGFGLTRADVLRIEKMATPGILRSVAKGLHIPYRTYDSGGWLPPGLTLAHNGTGRAERIIAGRDEPQQPKRMHPDDLRDLARMIEGRPVVLQLDGREIDRWQGRQSSLYSRGG